MDPSWVGRFGKGREGIVRWLRQEPYPQAQVRRVWVVARNWEDREVEEKLILYAGGEERESQKILLPPRGSTQAQFILSAGDFSKAVVQVSGDDALSWTTNGPFG